MIPENLVKENLVDTIKIFCPYETTVRYTRLNNTTHNRSHKIYKVYSIVDRSLCYIHLKSNPW